MSETKSQTDLKTIRDRLKDSDRVILTRGLNVPDEEGVKRRYPAGKYTAAELPAIAYEQGLVIEDSFLLSEPFVPEVKPAPDLSKELTSQARSRPGSQSKTKN